MSRLIIRLLANALALWVAVLIVPGLSHEGSGLALLGVAFIFGLVNALVRPIILFLTCPLVILTLGLFVLVVNTIMLSLTIALSDALGLGFFSEGFGWTFLGALVVSVVSGVLTAVLKDDDEDSRRKRR